MIHSKLHKRMNISSVPDLDSKDEHMKQTRSETPVLQKFGYEPDLDSFQRSFTDIHGFLMHLQELNLNRLIR